MPEIKIKHLLPGDTVASALAEQCNHFIDTVRSRAYELFDIDERKSGGELDHWLYAEREVRRPIKVEVSQDASEYVISLLVLGYESTDVNIYSLSDSLVVTGKLAATISRGRGTSTEQRRSIFYQWIYPEGVSVDGITAVLQSSSLTINIPRADLKPVAAIEERLAGQQSRALA